MIDDTLVFLKNSLNAHLKMGGTTTDPQEDQVVFPVGQATDSIVFKLGAVTLLLLTLEQDNVLHAPNLYRRTLPDGSTQSINPDIRLNLSVLFVANHLQYEDSLRILSAIIQYFQNHRFLNQQNAPALDDDIDLLLIELVTPTLAEQNEIWGALRAHYHPSLMYRIKTLIFEGDVTSNAAAVQDKSVEISQ